MNKKRVLIAVCTVVLLVGAFAVSKNGSTERASLAKPPQHGQSEAAHTVPEHVVYGFLFHKVALLNRRISELQAQGHARQASHPLQTEGGLSREQAGLLSAIAISCEQEVRLQDERAKVIIDAFRARFPERKISKDATPPAPPPELKTMWEERNVLILRARDRLHSAFGEDEFSRFDNYAKIRFGANIRPVATQPDGSTPK